MSISILLVDDSDVNLKVASLMLKKLGHQADIATNGIEAIEALETSFLRYRAYGYSNARNGWIRGDKNHPA